MSDSVLFPIPGYEDTYWINSAGIVFNKANHRMKVTKTSRGDVVELRKEGQRERLFVQEILRNLFLEGS